MLRLLRASEVARSVFDVDYERLWDRGVRALLFDLDNTLGRRGSKRLGDEARRLLGDLQARGFRVGILTNRKRGPANELALELAKEFTVLDVARKPHRAGFASLLAQLGQPPARAAMIGDRRLTDILGANRSGIYSIRVKGFRR
jgi:HAD superfamily phosphatase (TIGR01668 family)